jgi:nicotinamide mononucleotide transporter
MPKKIRSDTMSYLMDLINVNFIIFNVWGHSISFIEFIGTLFGLLSVCLATRINMVTWLAGVINHIAFLLLFYQVQLYLDMLFQIYFTLLCIYGWVHWKMSLSGKSKEVMMLGERQRIIWLIGIGVIAAAWGTLIAHIHTFLPEFFPYAVEYPYIDAFIAVGSIIACFLMARKIVEAWILWVLVDIVSIIFNAVNGVYFITTEYGIFLAIASYGLYGWIKELNEYKLTLNRSRQWYGIDY